jgi:hypothetical protein
MVVVERKDAAFAARELSTDEIGEQQQAIADAEENLRNWRSVIAGTKSATKATGTHEPEPPPSMPPATSN